MTNEELRTAFENAKLTSSAMTQIAHDIARHPGGRDAFWATYNPEAKGCGWVRTSIKTAI